MVAREIGPGWLEFVLKLVLEPEHTNSWCKLKRLQKSSVGKTRCGIGRIKNFEGN